MSGVTIQIEDTRPPTARTPLIANSRLSDQLSRLSTRLSDGLSQFATRLRDGLSQFATRLRDGLSRLPTRLRNGLSQIATRLCDGLSQLATCLRDQFTLLDILFIFLLALQAFGLAAIAIYCVQTYICAKKVKYPHYHCEIAGTPVPYETAMKVELAFVVTELLSRFIFLAFSFKAKRKKSTYQNICRSIWKVPELWFVILYYLLCVFRFSAILSDRADLGRKKNLAGATIVMYIFDGLTVLFVAVALNDVKIQDLDEDNRNGTKLFRRPGYVFKILLGCFWLQFFVYAIAAVIQFAFGVDGFTSDSMDLKKAFSLANKFGELLFLRQISGWFWVKCCDDSRHIIGARKDVDQGAKEERQESKNLACQSPSSIPEEPHPENQRQTPQSYGIDIPCQSSRV